MTDIQLIMIIGAQVGILLGMLYYLSRQISAAEMRQAAERHESERRLTEQIQGVERRFTEQIQGVERRLVEQYRETNRDTKTLIHAVGVLQGSMGIPSPRSESDSGEAAEAAD